MKRSVIVAFLFLGTSLAVPSGKKYRDYEYNRITDAFYKLHVEPIRASSAINRCSLEGAKLMPPSNNEDIAQAHGMMKKFPDLDMVFIGNDGQTHDSAEENPIIDLTDGNDDRNLQSQDMENCEVINREGKVLETECYRSHPYVCKVEAKDAVSDERCGGVYSTTGYKYYANVRSCYSVPPLALTWTEAYEECRAEGAHLVVLNSEQESDVVKELLKLAPRAIEAKTSYFFFAGIRAERVPDSSQRVFRTIFNETLEAAGFAAWSDGEPNNYMDSEYCGTIFSGNGKYNDANCSHMYGFICEKEVP